MAEAVSKTQDLFAFVNKNGLAKTNRFEVVIDLPEKIKRKMQDNNNTASSAFTNNELFKVIKKFIGTSRETIIGLNAMCEMVEFPGRTFATGETKYNGDMSKTAYGAIYMDMQTTFKVTRDMHEKNLFDEWSNLIIDEKTHHLSYKDEYVCPRFIINQLDTEDQVVHTIELVDAFPLSISPMESNQEAQNSLHKLTVSWSFSKYKNLNVEGPDVDDIFGLRQTPFGPMLEPFLSNPAVQKGLEVLKDSGIDLEGEAVNIYNMVNDVVINISGESINKSVSLLNSIYADTLLNELISTANQTQLLDTIDQIIRRIK